MWSDDTRKALPIFVRPYLFIHWPLTGDGTQARAALLDALRQRQEEAPPLGAYI